MTEPTLLGLPVELRLSIFEYLLVRHEPICVTYFGLFLGYMQPKWIYDRNEEVRQPGLCPTILRVSKQTYHECLKMFYQKNHFYFQSYWFRGPETGAKYDTYLTIPDIELFISQVAPNAKLLQHIGIQVPCLSGIPRQLSLYEDYAHVLDIIRIYCTDLKTLSMVQQEWIQHNEDITRPLKFRDSSVVLRQLAALSCASFEEMKSLEKVFLVYEHCGKAKASKIQVKEEVLCKMSTSKLTIIFKEVAFPDLKSDIQYSTFDVVRGGGMVLRLDC